MISVGASTETEMKQKKARVEDALHATRAAAEEGILAGGGVVTSIHSAADAGGLVRASQRVQVRAASLVWERALERAIYAGGVRMVQGAAEMTSDRLELETSDDGQRRLVAEGNVLFEDPDGTPAPGEHYIYRVGAGNDCGVVQ